MCVGIPAMVVGLGESGSHTAVVEISGVRREVNTMLVHEPDQPVVVGEWLLLHVGFAMSRIDEEEAARTLEFMRELGSVYDDELEAFSSNADLEEP